jgi:hypothetical protein
MRNFSMYIVLSIFTIMSTTALISDNRKIKIYVPTTAIQLTENEILVDMNGEMFSVDKLFKDDDGYYIVQIAYRDCPECGHRTFDTMKLKCTWCGFPNFGE